MQILWTGVIHAGEFSKLLLQIDGRTLNDKNGYITIIKKIISIHKVFGTTL